MEYTGYFGYTWVYTYFSRLHVFLASRCKFFYAAHLNMRHKPDISSSLVHRPHYFRNTYLTDLGKHQYKNIQFITPLEILENGIFPGGECFCLGHLLSDE